MTTDVSSSSVSDFIGRLTSISSSLNRTIGQIRSNPSRANDLGEELNRSFLFNVRQTQTGRKRKAPNTVDKRKSTSLRVHLTCLQDPNVDRSNINLNLDHLTSIGLGVPISERQGFSSGIGRQKSILPLSWSAQQLRDFIYAQFQPLQGHDYVFTYSTVGGRLCEIPSQVNTPDLIRVHLADFRRSPGIIFIRPTEYIRIEDDVLSSTIHADNGASIRRPSSALGAPPSASRTPSNIPPSASGAPTNRAPSNRPSSASGAPPNRAPSNRPSSASGAPPNRAPSNRPSSASGPPSNRAPSNRPSSASGAPTNRPPCASGTPSNPSNIPSTSASGVPSNRSSTSASGATSDSEPINISFGRPERELISLGEGFSNSDSEEGDGNEIDSIHLVRPRPRTTAAGRMRNRRRRAAQVARDNIREWCGNRNNAHSEDEVMPDSLNSVPLIHGNVVDNQGMSITEIRFQQDQEYQMSLLADQKKDQDRREEEEKIKNERLEAEKRIAGQGQLREQRRQDLPTEPENGFFIKIRGGERRRFTEIDPVQVLINFVGSQHNSTQDFEIKVAGVTEKINSWSSTGLLQDFGIRGSCVVEVEFDIERPACSLPNISTYSDLMCTIANDSDEESEISEEETVDLAPEEETSNIRDLLLDWRINTMNYDDHQKIVISRRPGSLWNHALKCYGRQSFNVRNVLKVEFRDECGEDEGGLRREFFEILLREMLKQSYFEDNGDGYEVSANMIGFVQGHFKLIGKMLASILIQGGAFPPCLAHCMVMYGVHGMRAATLETCDMEHRKVIKKIENEEDFEKANNDQEVQDILEEADIRLTLSKNSKMAIVKALIAKFSRLNNKSAILEQFWEGAEELGLQSFLRKHTAVVTKMLCKCCGIVKEISGDEFMEFITVTKIGEPNSNSRNASEEVAQNFESFVYDCEEGKCCYDGGSITVGNILQFITGCSSVPPGGFESKFNLQFTRNHCYPTVSTCTFTITLPLNLENYNKFKEVMIESIISGPGFGLI